MKIAISSTGKDFNSAVDPRFGRADYLIIADTESGEIVQVIENLSAKEAAQGAGIHAASRIAEAGVKVLLTGRVGPKAAVVCEKAGITMINNVTGNVAEAIRTYTSSFIPPTPQNQSNEHPVSTSAGQGCRRGQGRGQRMGGGSRRGCGAGRQQQEI